MPRPSRGARIWYDKTAKLWLIRDGSVKRGTGCGIAERARAEEKLAQYIAERYEPPSDNRPSQVLVADVLTYYSRYVATNQKSEATVYAVQALLGWWKARPISDIKRSTCQAYVDYRASQSRPQARTKEAKERKVSPGTARRELAVLRAAVNAYHKENPLDALPVVTLPEPSPARSRWLTRTEAASLLHAARNLDDKQGRRALCRFILLGLYTGTRSGAIRSLGWMPNTIGGWIDIEGGVIHRRPDGEAETNKRKPPARIPDRLLGSLTRWREADLRPTGLKPHAPIPYVIHYRGKPIDKQRKTWAEARIAANLSEDVTPHILRHTCVTWLMLNGNDPYDVANYVGMSVQMLDDVYGHHHPDHQKQLASRIGRKR